MYKHNLKKLPKNVFEITVDIDKKTVADEYDLAFEKIRLNITFPGFRAGKAPADVAKKHIAKDKIYQEMIKSLLPKIYEEIVKKESLLPVVDPKVELVNAKDGEDWQIKITVAGKPNIELNNYKDAIKAHQAENKKKDIWVPGKNESPKETENKQKNLNDVLSILLKEAKVEIADLIIEAEINRKLTHLVDDIQKIGLTVDSYLKSKNLSLDQLKESFKKEVEDTYKLEFILSEIADKENISIEKKDLDKLFENIKDDKEKKIAEQNAYFYASILRKQKTIDFLLSL